MKITDHILKSKKTLFSFEIIPPKKGNSIQELYDNIDPLMEFKPPFIDVTTSREQFVYVEKDRGLLERKTTRTRPGTLGICASIKHKYDVDTVPHVLCGGFTKEETQMWLNSIKDPQVKPKKRKRARKKDGTFRGDDKSTPNVNEAWENE